MIWVGEIILMLIFVGLGGPFGFVAWAAITAIVLFAQHSSRQARLKAAELELRRQEMAARQRWGE